MSIKTKTELTAAFIAKARSIHGNRYDYSRTEYVNYNTKVTIICSVHGAFDQRAGRHLEGRNCPKCSFNAHFTPLTTEVFIDKARAKHGDTYDYGKVQYTDNNTVVVITCPRHGDFKQTPRSHLRGHGCPQCGYEKMIHKQRSALSVDIPVQTGLPAPPVVSPDPPKPIKVTISTAKSSVELSITPKDTQSSTMDVLLANLLSEL